MLSIPIPDSAYSEVEVSLGGSAYNFVFNYNSMDTTYRLDIFSGGESVIYGVLLIEGSSLLGKYTLPLFDHGELFVAKLEATDRKPSRDNIGLGKAYELLYISDDEMRG